eukprot:1621544-Rhodomonas_salina.1
MLSVGADKAAGCQVHQVGKRVRMERCWSIQAECKRWERLTWEVRRLVAKVEVFASGQEGEIVTLDSKNVELRLTCNCENVDFTLLQM